MTFSTENCIAFPKMKLCIINNVSAGCSDSKSYHRKAEKLFHLYEGGWVFGHPHTGDHILLHLLTQIHGT